MDGVTSILISFEGWGSVEPVEFSELGSVSVH